MSSLSNQQINSSFSGLLQVPGGITSTLQTVQDGNGNATGLLLSSTSVNAITASNYTATNNGSSISGAIARLISNGFADTLNVKDFGALGDGSNDDTSAFQAAINYACSTKNIGIYIPSGRYKITSALNFALSPPVVGQNHFKVSVFGDGFASQILQYSDSALFSFTGEAHEINFANINVICKTSFTGSGNALKNKAVFYFPDGNAQAVFTNVYSHSDPGETTFFPSFYVCGYDKTNDQIYFNYCTAVINQGYGYKLGQGSAIYIDGGRIVGQGINTGSVGLYLSGNNNFYAWGTDFIALGTGLNSINDNGASNRELFITQCSFDSSNIGINISDNAYVNIVGCWTASCADYNINYAPPSDSGILNISGGTIFNANISNLPGKIGYGLSINRYGKISITNVVFRNNLSRAISSNDGARIAQTTINNCQFYDNGNTSIAGSCQAFLAGSLELSYNNFRTGSGSYAVPNVTVDAPSISVSNIFDNVGYQGFGLRTAITLPATGVSATNDTGQRLQGYVRGGTVTTISMNGTPVYDYGAGAAANCLIILEPNDTFIVNYTVAPSIAWKFV